MSTEEMWQSEPWALRHPGSGSALRTRLRAGLASPRLPFLLIGWIVLFTLGSLFIANPFVTEASAAVAPDFWSSMYLHGLLTALVGVLALVVCQVFAAGSPAARGVIAGSAVVATVATGIGGVFDTRLPGAEAATFTQNLGFLALDAMLVALIVAMVGAMQRRGRATRTLAFWTALPSVAAMLLAAVLGHVAGWMMQFGAWPGFLADYLRGLGIDSTTMTEKLIVAHSREMVAAVMSLLVALAAQQFGAPRLGRASRAVVRAGLLTVTAGLLLTAAVYVAMGITAWEPPALFQLGGGSNGILLDQLVLGLTVMLGGAVTLVALAVGRGLLHPLRLVAAWSWLLSFATVVVAGYAIELDETYFGAGDPGAAGAPKDAVFTWLHQDVGLFLLPALVLVMVLAERHLGLRLGRRVAWLAAVGASVTFVGVMVWVFVDPRLHGAGYAICTTGIAVIGLAVIVADWAGLRRPAEPAAAEER